MILERVALLGAGGTLLLVGALVLSLTAGKRDAERDRDTTTTWAENVCISVGSFYKAENPKTRKPLARNKWGEGCAKAIASLQRNANAGASVIVTHEGEQEVKRTVDTKAARRSSTRILKAQQTLETAHAAAEDGRYGREWINGLSDAFGLRDRQEAGPSPASADGGDAEGPPVVGPAGLLGAPTAPAGGSDGDPA